MASELQQVEELCNKTESPVVYCHNDLLSGNVLVMGQPPGTDVSTLEDEQLQLQLIDFEYGCFSFRAFDWGGLSPLSFSPSHSLCFFSVLCVSVLECLKFQGPHSWELACLSQYTDAASATKAAEETLNMWSHWLNPPSEVRMQANTVLCAAGNHFNEWAGFECAWHNLPSDEQQTAFVRAYLQRTAELEGHEGAVSDREVRT